MAIINYHPACLQDSLVQNHGQLGFISALGTCPYSVSTGFLHPKQCRLGYRAPMDTEHEQVPHVLINLSCPWSTCGCLHHGAIKHGLHHPTMAELKTLLSFLYYAQPGKVVSGTTDTCC